MIHSMLHSFWCQEEGQDMVEYSLLLAFIALGIVGLLVGVSPQVSGLWSTANSTLVSTNSAAVPPAS